LDTLCHVLVRSAAALAGGVILALAFEPVGLAILLPVGVATLFLSVHGLRVRRAWLPGLLFGIAFCFSLMVWMRAVGPDAWLALAGAEAVYFVPLGMALAVLGRMRWWPLWSAIAWVAVEAWRGGWPFGGMPWGRLAYATAGTPWESGLPWLGMTGVSLVVALVGGWLAWLVLGGFRRPAVAGLTALALAGLTLLPTLTSYDVGEGREVTVAAVQGDVPGAGDDLLSVHREVTANHVQLTTALAADVAAGQEAEPDFVVWPENSTAVDPFLDSEVNAGVVAASEAIGVPILVGAMVDSPREDEVLNQGIVWEPGLGGGDRYTKHHPVPFGEYIPWRDTVFTSNFGKLALIPRDMASGTRLEPVRIDGALVADAICFDIAYDDGVHQQVANGGEMLAVQTSNAMFIRTAQIDQQFEITRLRAVETGRYVVVAATNGVTGIVAPDGEVVARAEPRTQEVLVEEVTLHDELTPAVRMGLWPGRAIFVLAALAVLVGAVTYRRHHRGTGSRERDHEVSA
jgi:apolipoprotein N-acyltransferase